MAGVQIPVFQVERTKKTSNVFGITGTTVATANWFENTGNEVLLLNHLTSGGTVYAQITRAVDGDLPDPKTQDVPDTDWVAFGPFPTTLYGERVQIWGDDAYSHCRVVRV